MRYVVRGISREVAAEVRATRLAPGYGHPAHLEIAGGTGPCRCCLQTFVPGQDRRLLFTYRPPGDPASLMAPGPVFIHADHCEAFAGDGFPQGLRGLPLAFEARTSGSRVIELSARQDLSAEAQITVLFEELFAQWVQVRHAQAGCYIARVDRASNPTVA